MTDKYKFDTESLQFKKQSRKYRFFKSYISVFVAGIFIGIAFLFISAYIITTPTIRKMRRENSQADKDLKALSLQYERIENVLKDLEKRDANIYKAVLESDPKNSEEDNLKSEASAIVDMLQNKSLNYVADYIQKEIDKTLAAIQESDAQYANFTKVLEEKAKMLANIPSVQPVENKMLEVMIYGFGKRIDPFYKTTKEHKGIDYNLPAGTRVFATAGGTVSHAGRLRKRGNSIEIDHGYGFKTVYDHLDKILVKAGNKVDRGDYIGTVGNSGKSISPHLHYEVHVNNKQVNPINFFFADINPEQYEKLIIFASRGGVSLD